MISRLKVSTGILVRELTPAQFYLLTLRSRLRPKAVSHHDDAEGSGF